jgi:predicted transcriptional regulator
MKRLAPIHVLSTWTRQSAAWRIADASATESHRNPAIGAPMRDVISLSPTEAACLTALRCGTTRKARIAFQAHLDPRQTDQALEGLAALDIATVDGRRTWHLTRMGETADVLIAPPVGKRGREPGQGWHVGPAATRLLALLDRPRHGADLRTPLGVTRERVRQLVVTLFARDLIRAADVVSPSFAIARKEDPALLLCLDQERVLSAFPETEATTLSKIALVAAKGRTRVAATAESLRGLGLIEKTGVATYGDLYRLTPDGAAHWQRSADKPRAALPTPPFRSARVREVLSHLEREGPTRTRDIGHRLDIPQTSINALMQCLKRKGAVRVQSDARHAPHELTRAGRAVLARMRREAKGAAAA